jgi:long-subunit acyl-CoA synthetase (AMP-forming)
MIGKEEKDGDWEKVKNSKELYDAVMASFLKEHGNSDLSHLEKLKAVVLLDSPWTPENGCLTPPTNCSVARLLRILPRNSKRSRRREFSKTAHKDVWHRSTIAEGRN